MQVVPGSLGSGSTSAVKPPLYARRKCSMKHYDYFANLPDLAFSLRESSTLFYETVYVEIFVFQVQVHAYFSMEKIRLNFS